MKTIALLGSTGSIGTQCLDIIRENSSDFRVSALTCGRNINLLSKQIEEFKPQVAVTEREEDAAALQKIHRNTEFFWGKEGLIAAASCQCDMVVNGLMGMRGLEPTYHAIKAGRDIALANKETLVCAGPLVMDRAREKGAEIVPVDSEHSAIFQSLQGSHGRELKRILLTASGGPFFGWTREALEKVTPDRALQHPNWSMGAKVTIDSATLMNKGLELLEAMSLFAVPPEKIQILIHRESILHSAVEYCDNSVIAQLGAPDMRLPIQYALSWPDRVAGPAEELDLFAAGQLTFAKPDLDTFPCLALAIRAAQEGGTAPAILNGANEVAVARFLAGEIGFLDIPRVVAHALDTVLRPPLTLEGVYAADQAARQAAKGEA